jgi:dnd system-associated protein 4
MRGIRRSEQFEEMVRQLAESQHPKVTPPRSIFPTMRDLMCFAAVLGFEYQRRRPLQAKTYEVDGRIFSNSEQALDLLYLIGLASSKDVNALREDNEEQIIQSFEEYAQGGFEILDGWLKEKPEDSYGDQAILAALTKHKFLDSPKDVDAAIGDISF